MTRIINVANYGAKGKCGVLDTLGIQLALFEARKGPVTVYIPKGEYHILYELVIYRNTNLILHDDATLIRKSPSAMLKNGHSFKKYYGYEGHGNINIIGGTFDAYGHTNNTNNTIMSIGHAKNIQIHDVTFKNVVGGFGRMSHGKQIEQSIHLFFGTHGKELIDLADILPVFRKALLNIKNQRF